MAHPTFRLALLSWAVAILPAAALGVYNFSVRLEFRCCLGRRDRLLLFSGTICLCLLID